MNFVKKRWLILAASCVINLCIGSIYSWSVFALPMAAYLNDCFGFALTAADLAVVFTVANSSGPVTMVLGGRIKELFGIKKVLVLGGLLFGGGMILSGFARSRAALILGYGIFSGLGMGAVYGCTISNTVNFFPDKKGLAGGIATASYGLGSVVVSPVANGLIDRMGVSDAFKMIGIAFAIVIIICAAFVETCPAEFVSTGAHRECRGVGFVPVDKNWRQMLASPIFYLMLLLLVCGAFSGMMCISQSSDMAQGMVGFRAGSAAMMVSVLALFNAAGRVGAGYVSDKIGRINTLRTALFLSLCGLALLGAAGIGRNLPFLMGFLLIGVSFGSFMGVYPGFTAEQFGLKNNGVNYGIMFTGFAAAGCFGPAVMTGIFKTTGSYRPAFLAASVLCVVGLVLIGAIKSAQQKIENEILM